ncbi:MAG TPA: formylglycine-generating enzyme family protein [Aquabacterium sp.]|uniref:formylglycine-generating enzyme family protein n=1 Tax=Aquabacterium sp. TaxID=1872578 RepID=UPI002E2F5856|nr:formylglycine-generating enzyme family protein [Aquabacterium sp.]HEX5357053.1 formylglycine-generating enzyme family protein [Aquabacterium sp.]
MTMRTLTLTFLLILFSILAYALPTQAEADMLMQEIGQSMQANQFSDLPEKFERIAALKARVPANFEYHWGRTLFEVKRYDAAMAHLDTYITRAGSEGKYYADALGLYTKAKNAIALQRQGFDCPGCPEMIQIPAGSFEMGSNNELRDEAPKHRVTVKTFAMSKTEITNRQFRQFRPGHDSGTYEGRSLNDDDQPVVNVRWDDAQAYVQWLTSKTGQPYRLPSEAEWEYAARGGSTSTWIWGNNPHGSCPYDNIADQTVLAIHPEWDSPDDESTTVYFPKCSDGYFVAAPVGRLRANAYGLHDMTGNVREWVEDCYHLDYDGAPTDGTAWVGGNCDRHVLRGSSWFRSAQEARLSARGYGYQAKGGQFHAGFRIVRTAKPL